MLSWSEDYGITTGIITNLKMSERETANDESGEIYIEKYLYAIYTNIYAQQSDSGSMLFDITGKIVGMNLVREGNVSVVPAGLIEDFIANYKSHVSGDGTEKSAN